MSWIPFLYPHFYNLVRTIPLNFSGLFCQINWNNILFFIIGFGGFEMNKCVSLGIINVFIIVTLPNTVSFLTLSDHCFIIFWICLILESKLYIIISSKFRVK